jgi:transcriptional regulator with XRE-family HTH domain
MDANAFRDKIARWRLDVKLGQETLDRECGFRKGTVARLEQGKLALTDEKLVRIVICTGRDLLWTLLEGCGSLFQRLQPLELSLRQELGKERRPQPLDQDGELQRALGAMFASLEIVLKKQTRAADRRALMMEILAEAAARDVRLDEPKSKRAAGPRKRKPASGSG